MEYHSAANLFPMMGDEEYTALKSDIKQNGLIEPIWFCDGQILDGRNRWKACLELGVDADFKEYTGADPIGFVVSLNLKRRHLNSSQRAIVAIEVERLLAVEAKERQRVYYGNQHESAPVQLIEQVQEEPQPPNANKASERAAKITGTNRQYVSDAKRIESTAPELIPQIAAGNMSIPEAKKEIKKREQQERIKTQNELYPSQTEVTAKLYYGDCFEHINSVEDSSISCAVIDPPYNVTNFDWDKIGDEVEFINFTKSWLDAIRCKFTDNYHLFVFCDASYSADIEMLLRRDEWPIKSRIIWEYRNLVMGRDSTDKFIQNWQMCFHIGNGKLNWDQVWNDSRFAVQVFATPQSNFDEGKYHPHQKPLGLIENLIKAGSVDGDTILDIFSGSGTTGIAATKNKRNAILIEADDNYCRIIENRLNIKRVD